MASAPSGGSSGGKPRGSVREVKQVQLDGSVVLKIIKHCQEEGSGSEWVTGCLVGVVVDETLEISNCFPFPKDSTDNPREEIEYQKNVLKKLRTVNVDYHEVGWYQSTYLGSHVSREFLEAHVGYQRAIQESVVLIYDPLQTSRGALSLKAYRLTPQILTMMGASDPFTPESVQQARVVHSDVLVELPVTLRSSRLTSVLLQELPKSTTLPSNALLGLSSTELLQKNVQLLMENVESLQLETYRLLGYEKNISKQAQQKQQFLQRRREENERREKTGEPPLPMTDEAIEQESSLKPVVPPQRLEALLIGEQVDLRCQQISEIAGAAFAKLYLAEGLQPN
ncbi:Eukaryotic translation initiation factor 3 subunit H-A [Geodia barretti]|uniref:Eukaryotic translation initiation factor 3 subunit H n=1 Tax=Geodia barretti TaxID=519541 RepID=A0AA35T753_GEOBA|nr:Eukaryotic translation initiation factor 3 subunit H-A [Geodia barretti]